MGASLLGTERGRYFGITSTRVNETSFEVDIRVLSSPPDRMWATPLDTIEAVVQTIRLGVQGLEAAFEHFEQGPPRSARVCSIFDDKRKIVICDLNVGWRRSAWRSSMERANGPRPERRESGSADFRDNAASPLS